MSGNPEFVVTQSEIQKTLKKKDGDQLFKMGESFQALMGEDDDSMALVFQKISPEEEEGEYTCVARTTRGLLTFGAVVHETLREGDEENICRSPSPNKIGFPHWKPQIVVEKTEVIANEGDQAMLQVQITGYPKPDVRCSRDEIPIKPSKKYKVFKEDEEHILMLVIKHVTFEDAGIYTIQAENEIGFDSVDILLTVVRHKYPEIKTKVEDISIDVEQLLVINIDVDGIPKPKVQFMKESREIKQNERIKIIESSNTHTLIILKTRLTDTGVYSIVVTNELAQVSQFWKIYVYSCPRFVKNLGKDFEVEQEELVFFKVKLESEPKPNVVWFNDGQEIVSSNRVIVDDDDGFYILKIKSSCIKDAGCYKFRATNIHGSCEDSVRMFVRKAPTILEAFQDTTILEQDIYHYVHIVEFVVKLDVYPQPEVKWFLDNVEIEKNRPGYFRNETENEIKFVIDDATTEHSGKYTCKIVNACGYAEHSAKLIVNCSPRIYESLNHITIHEKKTLELEVSVRGYPSPTYKWFRNGCELTASNRIKTGMELCGKHKYKISLRAQKVDYDDRGDYTVAVSNVFGTARSSCTVDVLTCPVIISADMKNQTVEEYSNVTFTVRAFSHPPPTAVWTWEGYEITSDGHMKIITSTSDEEFRLGLRKVKAIDAGKYKCILSNEVGKTEKQCVLQVVRRKN